MKKKFVLSILALIATLSSPAVTREEMEQARTITAHAFLRYMNNGSGYLDEMKTKPATVADLKKSLKNTELENLKTFESISYPGIETYKDWGKSELLEFWGTKFFSDSKVPEAGKQAGAKSRVKTGINAMTISTPNSTEQRPTTEDTDAKTQAEAQRRFDSIANAEAIAAEEAIIAASQNNESADTSQIESEATDLTDEPAKKSKGSSTLTYVIILVILIILVVILVVFAMNAMKKSNNQESDDDNSEDTPDLLRYESIIAEQERTINRLNAEVERLNSLIMQRNDKDEDMDSEEEADTNFDTTLPETTSVPLATPRKSRPTRTLYLAYANSKGMFVRADSIYNEDFSIFKLVTSDGVSGSFTILTNPTAQKLAMSLPVSVLSNACTSDDMQHGNWSGRITTESAGTAMFENGRWIVKRKAEINFI